MNLICDQNLSANSIAILRSAGHDVLAIREDHPGMKDPDVLALAARTQRVIVTEDRDFGDLVFHRQLPVPPGIIYVRRRRGAFDFTGESTRTLIERDGARLLGHLVVIELGSERWRPLPT